MDAEAVNRYLGFSRIEGFIFIVRDITAVQCVGKVCTEALHVELTGAQTDFLIRCKAQLNRSVGCALSQQFFHRLQDNGNTSLVIGPQQRCAVSADQILADELFQFREVAAPHHNILLRIQHQITAIIVEDLRLHVLAGHIRRSVHMSDQSDYRQMLTAGSCRQRGIHIASIVHKRIVHAHTVQFFYQQPCHIKLAVRAGSCAPVCVVVAFTPHLSIAHQTRNNIIHNCDSPYSSSDSRFSGFRHFRSSSTNKPSFLISTSSNQISPPPYSGVWI